MTDKFSHEKSLKTPPEDTFFNLQSFLFIGAKRLTRFFYYTKISPHLVILLSMLFGLAASHMIIQSDMTIVVVGAFLLFYKNVLDKVDGSLARAKGLDSRRGRFYDSISDFIVTLASFSAIGFFLLAKHDSLFMLLAAYAAMIFSMLQCSYFIFYQVSFIRLSGKNTVNRIVEKVTEEDIFSQDKWTTFLQQVFQVIYGWQDRLFYVLDKKLYSKFIQNTPAENYSEKPDETTLRRAWYGNKKFLTLASSLSIGTHILLICITAITRTFEYYLFMNLICMNLLLILSVVYHYFSSKKLLITRKN
jgi:phosphatidylglycerophosphate synthase